MNHQKLSLKHLQQLSLASQGLHKTRPFGKGKAATLAALQQLGYVQIDTLSVVARAHHHTLWNRVPDYQETHLDQLVAERKVFEYWFHAAAYMPMADFRFALPRMQFYKDGNSPFYKDVDPKVMAHVLDKIRIDGPQKARDFESETQKPGSWWNWKPTKKALEKLFFQGDLMISGREGMQKVYDLTERVLPTTIDARMPTLREQAEHLVDTHLRAYGPTTPKQITHLRKGPALRKAVAQVLQDQVAAGLVTIIAVDGAPDHYVRTQLLEQPIPRTGSALKLLSPFDNAIIHRDRTEQLFGFNYRIECYTPEPKRQFGYFCLPILYKGQFLGRADCKAHRKTGIFEVIHLHVEHTPMALEKWLNALMKTLRQFALFNGCHSLKLTQVSPKSYEEPIRKAFLEQPHQHQ